MATNPISSSGYSLDINSLVSQLMEVERQPLLRLQQKEAAYQAKISAYATLLSSVTSLKSAVSDLTAIGLIGRSATVSDTTFMTASATSSASTGAYNIKINNIATAQSIYSTTFASESSEVADLTTYATQKLKIQVGSGTAAEITITSSNNTLSGIKDAINSANAGVSASIVNSGFVIDSSNKTIVFNDGSNRTATLTEGTYTGSALAAEVKRALEAANAGSDTYTVSYDSSNKFSIANDASNTNPIDILWEDASTTAEGILGFTSTDHDAIAVGSSTTGDNAVAAYRLILTANSAGTSNRITIKVDEDNDGTYEESTSETDTTGMSRLAFNATYDSSGNVTGGVTNMTQSQAAVDAKIKVDSLEITRSSNTITDVITGVTLNLLKGDSYATSLTLQISEDSSSLTTKISSFVSAYNSTMNAINGLKGNITQTGVLAGDSTLTTLSIALRSVTTTRYGTGNTDNTLSYIGITHDKNGVLGFDSSKLSTAISSNTDNVTSIINQMSTSLESTLSSYINTIIPAREDGYQQTVENIQGDEENLERRLQLTEVALRNKFIALDQLLNQLQGTNTYITQQMEILGKIFGGK